MSENHSNIFDDEGRILNEKYANAFPRIFTTIQNNNILFGLKSKGWFIYEDNEIKKIENAFGMAQNNYSFDSNNTKLTK